MRKKILGWGLLVLVVTGIGGMLVWTADQPPIQEIEKNRRILSEAEKLNAEIYSHQMYMQARNQYDSAMILWKKENESFIFWRRYDSVRWFVAASTGKAIQAVENSQKVQQNTRKELQEEIALLRQEMRDFEKTFVLLPLGRKVINQHSRGKLLLNEAEIAFEKADYNAGRLKSREAAGLIRSAYRSGQQLLDHYLKKLPEWQKQLEQFLESSRKQKEVAIVVQKIPARCIFYDKGVKKYSFRAEFGKNWLGDKCCEGDYATPEGEYHIIKRLQGPMTRYYKALLLDYPNADDRARFEKLKKSGRLPRNVRAGSLIEIHGEGGRGAHWTNGCVALENEDMAVLYRNAGKGTSVLIIGAGAEE